MSSVPPQEPYGQPPYGGAPSGPPYGTGGPPYGGPYGWQPQAPAPLSPSDERTWATLAHVGGIVVGFLASLIVWLVFRERSAFVDDQAKEALNFQITLTVGGVVLAIVTFWAGGLGWWIAWVVGLVFMIQGAMAANRGQAYRYPINWRVVR